LGPLDLRIGQLILRARPPGKQPEQVRMFRNLLNQVSVVSDGYDAIASCDKFSPDFNIAPCLQRIVMDRAVAEHADIRRVEEIRCAMHLKDGTLCVLRQQATPLGKPGQALTGAEHRLIVANRVAQISVAPADRFWMSLDSLKVPANSLCSFWASVGRGGRLYIGGRC
jgi:hypothetical protein